MSDATPQFSLDFTYAYGEPEGQGVIKSRPEDFIVQEIYPEQFSGDGEHHYVLIEKQSENTHWLAKQLAEFCSVDEKSIGFAGLKDRNALTRQWFSIQMPGKTEFNWQGFDQPNWKILKTALHNKKLRRGDHLGNRFVLTIRDVQPSPDLETRLANIKKLGVPNYFGEQRFGVGGENLNLAEQWFVGGRRIKNRKQKGFALSAARSYLFNQLLSKRVAIGNWHELIPGDLADGPSPTGPMWGRGRLATSAQALQLEQAISEQFATWCDALEHQGLSQERRALCLKPDNLSWRWQDDTLVLGFHLPAGQFATSVLRELLHYTTAPAY